MGDGEERLMGSGQNVNNACGLYPILHAISNGETRNYISKYFHLVSLPPPLVQKIWAKERRTSNISSQLPPLQTPNFVLPAKTT